MLNKAIIYNRVSTTEQNPELQIKECEELCKSKGWEIIDRLQEKASAFKDESKRDKFNEMIHRAERREFNHIVVWNMIVHNPKEKDIPIRIHFFHYSKECAKKWAEVGVKDRTKLVTGDF